MLICFGRPFWLSKSKGGYNQSQKCCNIGLLVLVEKNPPGADEATAGKPSDGVSKGDPWKTQGQPGRRRATVVEQLEMNIHVESITY